MKPPLTGTSTSRTSFLPMGACNTGDDGIPLPPPLLHPAESTSRSPPPPPLLYIPAAAQRVTHLHGPPKLQRFPSTSPTREQESVECAEQQRISIDRNAGPPPLTRFPPVVIEVENENKDHDSEGRISNEPFSTQSSSSELRSCSSSSESKNELKADSPASNSALPSSGRSSSSLSDLTKISQIETEAEGTASGWRKKEMPLLRRHSSASQDAVCFEELVNLPGRSRVINSRSSPPQLQRVPISAGVSIQRHPGQLEPSSNLVKTSAGASETSVDQLETSGSRLESSASRIEHSGIENSGTGRETSTDRVQTSVVGLGTSCNQFETIGGRLPSTTVGRYETSRNGLQTSGDRLETSNSRFDTSYSRLSPNLSLQPPRLVRHTTSGQGLRGANLTVTTLHSDLSSSGGSSPLRASPLAFSAHRNSPRAFQENNYQRPIAIAEAGVPPRRPTPVVLATKDRYKSTYVFSNRPTFVPPENEPRPLQVSSLILPSKHGVSMAPNLGEVGSVHFQPADNFSQSDERCSFARISPHLVQNQYAGNHSSPYIVRSHECSSEASRQYGESLASRRIPSPRSDLLSRISNEPANTSCMSRVGVPSPGSPFAGDQPTALRSNIRHKDSSLESFPPMWSHLESPYPVPSISSRNSSPKPYTFSVNLPQASLPTRHSGSPSLGSRSNSSTPTLEGYSLAPIQTTDHQRASVIHCANLNRSGSPNSIQHGLRVDERENSTTYRLPPAFQAADSRHSSRTNAIFSESVLTNTLRERSTPGNVQNDRSCGDLNRKTSSPLLRHVELSSKHPFSKSPSLNSDTPSPLPGHNEFHANLPSSKSPNPKVTKIKVTDLAVPSSVSDLEKSSVVAGKKPPGSKHKQTVCSSPVFHPSEEEFKDPVAYIKMIRHEAEKFGVCVIVPPESWKVSLLCCSYLTVQSFMGLLFNRPFYSCG